MAMSSSASWKRGKKVPGGGGKGAFGACGSETMNTMTYKGYTARIDFDERDSIFIGRVLGVRAIISFHGETVAERRAQFIAAVDDYLKDCAA